MSKFSCAYPDSERTHCLKKHPKAWLLKQIEKKLEVNPIEVAPIIVEKVNAAYINY